MGSDQTDRSLGQLQTGLWFGNIDDLWEIGKPTSWGGVWHKQEARSREVCDPFLMTSFDPKVAHLKHTASSPVQFKIEVDFLGDGSWETYKMNTVRARGYAHHEFPAGFSAHWVRVTARQACNATVYFIYS